MRKEERKRGHRINKSAVSKKEEEEETNRQLGTSKEETKKKMQKEGKNNKKNGSKKAQRAIEKKRQQQFPLLYQQIDMCQKEVTCEHETSILSTERSTHLHAGNILEKAKESSRVRGGAVLALPSPLFSPHPFPSLRCYPHVTMFPCPLLLSSPLFSLTYPLLSSFSSSSPFSLLSPISHTCPILMLFMIVFISLNCCLSSCDRSFSEISFVLSEVGDAPGPLSA